MIMHRNRPLITVGLPVYNCERYLELAINSILLQSYVDFELIIINDGSTDNTEKIIKSFNDPRIKYIKDTTRRGLVYRLNQLIDLASGSYFVRMDADDIMFPYRLEMQLQGLMLNPDPNCIAISAAVLIDTNNLVLGFSGVKSPKQKIDVFYGVYPIHPTIMGSIDWFRRYKYDSRMYRIEDFDLWYRAVDNTVFIEIEKPVIFYRRSSSLKSSTYFVTLDPLRQFSLIHKEFFWGSFIFLKMVLMGLVRIFWKRDFTGRIEEKDKLFYQACLGQVLSNEK
jgi:glycosyltransferase involved in cell wall biosynthesis